MGRIDQRLLSRQRITDRFRVGNQNLVPWLLSFDGQFGGFLGGRIYRQPILVGVSNQAVADYQLALTFDYDSAKMNSDLSDLLISDAVGNILPHWVEKITSAGYTADLTSGGSYAASSANEPGEGVAKAFDNSTSTKWLAWASTAWIYYNFGSTNKKVITKYTICTANDASGRDPKNWQFQGSNDGSTWYTLDTQTNQLSGAARYACFSYTFSNTTEYQYYRLNITANWGDSYIQISELQMFESLGSTVTAYVKIPTTSTSVKQLLYMYYGLPGATDTSDIDAVMDVGLRAFLYDGTGFNTYLGTTIDTSVSHNWGSGVVSINGVGNQTDTASIKWQGWVKPDGLGNTVFYGSSDDGQRLYINGSLVINNWVDQGTTEKSATVNLQDIASYEYQYYENGGGAVAMQGWDSPNSAKVYPIPSTYLRCKKYISIVPSTEFLAEETEATAWDGKYLALKGAFTMQALANAYRYVDLTNVADYTIQSGDILEFDIFWDDANAEVNLDLIASGWTLRDSGLVDQNSLSMHTSSYAHNTYTQGKWYTRRVALTGTAVGKVVSQFCIVCEKDEGGTFTGYLANVKIWRSGSIVKNIYVGGSVTENVVLNSGTNSHVLTANLSKSR